MAKENSKELCRFVSPGGQLSTKDRKATLKRQPHLAWGQGFLSHDASDLRKMSIKGRSPGLGTRRLPGAGE